MAPTKAKGRSRNGTPISAGGADTQAVSGSQQLTSSKLTYEDILDRYCKGAEPPASTTLRKVAEALKICGEVARTRSEDYDRGLRNVSRKKKTLAELVREEEIAERAEKARLENIKLESRHGTASESRPLAVGAHSVARQDRMDVDDQDEDGFNVNSDNERAPSSSSSESSRQPPPAPPRPQAQTFGEDPTTFDDPTIYHIREITEDTTDEEKKEILGVAYFPKDDLHELTPGTPPDRDFSNAKPPNQVTATQFANYMEPYFRPITQEDMAFLEERGDRAAPFVIPRRGQHHYRDVWAEEDGRDFMDDKVLGNGFSSQNKALGSFENMSDDVLETNVVSTGPMLSRLLASMRPERRIGPEGSANAQGNGEVKKQSSVERDVNHEVNGDDQTQRPLPAATAMTESAQPGWKIPAPRMDYDTVEERIKQELRHVGFLSEEAEPDYDGHNDDEVAARLRYLQEELQRVSVINGARKARITELAEERMAQQEWSTIADDLDTQINQAYLKRYRNISKGRKVMKRPGGPGGGSHLIGANGGGLSKPSIGEPIKALLERRHEWYSSLGPIVDYGRQPVPEESIFDQRSMKRLIAKEQEQWTESRDV